eukprot:PhM_4_TR3601/c0_g3_i1/m.87486
MSQPAADQQQQQPQQPGGAPREVTYQTSDPCQESLERMTRRLAVDLRGKIRRLQPCEPLTPDWLETADTLQHLASVAAMEEKDARKNNQGSVWEREELCIRLIVEEGKINMLMRSLAAYKQMMLTTPAADLQALLQSQAANYGDEARVRIRMFEQGVGVLLRCAMTAVEALQTLDLVALLEHIAVVLQHTSTAASYTPNIGDLQNQEVLVFHYLSLIFQKIDSLNEERVAGKVMELGIVVKALEAYQRMAPVLDKETTYAVVYFMSHLMETETFKTHVAEFLPSKEDKQRLVVLEAAVKERMASDPDRRKTLRCLSDCIIRWK